jgi:hypothetical protein
MIDFSYAVFECAASLTSKKRERDKAFACFIRLLHARLERRLALV